MKRRLALMAIGLPVVLAGLPVVLVQGIILWRTDYKANCDTDAWMSHDFRLWAAEIRASQDTRH